VARSGGAQPQHPPPRIGDSQALQPFRPSADTTQQLLLHAYGDIFGCEFRPIHNFGYGFRLAYFWVLSVCDTIRCATLYTMCHKRTFPLLLIGLD
jgi:hypothetical protein